ncbi:serine/threonine-protein kinase BLUS1 [Quercus suber]|uniref:Serine/threonine-protein kinase blus1 n=1 Tax=Quercus suber TaxID=58331 RepID=A0AAW0I4Y7_QUESU|nr:serine/threonine-protein kinase BLUS1-like [Quercus suber]POE99739.1 serine/threonine-protein kinase blus1 [Quercus suber]
MDYNGSVRLTQSGLISFSSFGNPYWIASEVKSPNPNLVDGYDMKADMWALGVTAVELVLGCPPLSQLPPSNSMLFKKISGRFGFIDVHERNKNYENKLSKEFQDMVIQCLDVDESKRPSIKILLDHDFFKNCTPSSDYLKLNLFQGLLSIEERFKNKELVECIFNAQRLEFDLGPPLLLSKGSNNGGGEGIIGRDGGGDN